MHTADNLQNTMNKQNKLCKTVVILGNSETGKTCILQRYTKKRFENFYMETIGVDYYSKEIVSKNSNLILSIWDTCGNELEYKILPSNVYKVASAYLIVCSYDKRESFEMLKSWILHVQYFINNHRNFNSLNTSYLVPIVVLINKSDIKQNRTFKLSDVSKMIDEFTLNILVYEVSAKENSKLDYVFDKVAALISGKVNINETSLNTTGLVDDLSISNKSVVENRKSFQLGDKFDRDKNKQGSCCNNAS